MLSLLRTQPTGSAITTFLDATISLRKGSNNIAGKPDVVFAMKTYEKIAKDKEENGEQTGDQILLPVNLFFKTLNDAEQLAMYTLYATCRERISQMTADNRKEVQDALQTIIFETSEKLDLPSKMIAFCRSNKFVYPDLSQAGSQPHHSKEKTFLIDDYIEITAISIFAKVMVPIWGEFIKELGVLDISANQKEKLAFDIIEPALEEGAFERIYSKLSFMLSSVVEDRRKVTDGKSKQSGHATTSFILTHNGIDDQMFDVIVMATIIVKRMATYECFIRLKDGNVPNAMVYIDDGIKRTADTKIATMRNTMNTMPRRELHAHDTEDNSSILDHASKTSKKSIDVAIFVTTAVKHWELPKLLEDTDTPLELLDAAAGYYHLNSFDVSPLCQAMVASFIGTRFGGSKCIGYLTPDLYQQVVVLLQVFLIRHGLIDLAALVSSRTSILTVDGPTNPVVMRISSNLKSAEYLECQNLFKGYLEKPVFQMGKKSGSRKVEVDRIDFVAHIAKMIEWLVRYNHSENMAPALWNFAQVEPRPIVGSECRYDENIIKNLCKFYLMFHGGQRPF